MPLNITFNFIFFFFASSIFVLFYYVILIGKYLFVPALFSNKKWIIWKFILNLLSGDEKYYYIGSVNSNNRSVTTKLLQGFQFFLIVYIQSFLEKSSN